MTAESEAPVCRARTAAAPSVPPLLMLGVLIAFAGSYLVVVRYVASLDIVDDLENAKTQFDLWAVLLGMVAAFAVAGAVLGVAWCSAARRLCDPRPGLRTWAQWVGSLILVGAFVFVPLFAAADAANDTIDIELARQIRPIIVAIAVASLPGLTGFAMIRSIAVGDSNWQEAAVCRLALMSRLRHDLQLLLTMFAGLLTLIVVATGMRRRMLLAHDATLSIPVEQVVLYGLLFAGLLAAAFGVAKVALDKRAAAIVDEVAGLPDPSDSSFSEVLKRRAELAGALGLGQGTRQSFESSVAIVAPLLTALIGAAIS